jgi:hypothetical protein
MTRRGWTMTTSEPTRGDPPMDEVDEFRRTILARQADAEAAFHQGDPGPRMEMWSRRDPVTLFGAAGMFKSGWAELSEIFPWVASRFSNASDYRFEVLVADVVATWPTRSDTSASTGPSTAVPSTRSPSAPPTYTAGRKASGRSFTAMATIRRKTHVPKQAADG